MRVIAREERTVRVLLSHLLLVLRSRELRVKAISRCSPAALLLLLLPACEGASAAADTLPPATGVRAILRLLCSLFRSFRSSVCLSSFVE